MQHRFLRSDHSWAELEFLYGVSGPALPTVPRLAWGGGRVVFSPGDSCSAQRIPIFRDIDPYI